MSTGGLFQPGGGCPGGQTEIEVGSPATELASRARSSRLAQRFSGGDRSVCGRPRPQRSQVRRSTLLSGSRRCRMPIASFCMRSNQCPDRARNISTLIAGVSSRSVMWIVPVSASLGGPEWRCDGLLALSLWMAGFGTVLLPTNRFTGYCFVGRSRPRRVAAGHMDRARDCFGASARALTILITKTLRPVSTKTDDQGN